MTDFGDYRGAFNGITVDKEGNIIDNQGKTYQSMTEEIMFREENLRVLVHYHEGIRIHTAAEDAIAIPDMSIVPARGYEIGNLEKAADALWNVFHAPDQHEWLEGGLIEKPIRERIHPDRISYVVEIKSGYKAKESSLVFRVGTHGITVIDGVHPGIWLRKQKKLLERGVKPEELTLSTLTAMAYKIKAYLRPLVTSKPNV